MKLFHFGPKRCRYADRCRYYQAGHPTCEDDKEASTGKGGEPYCGAFRRFKIFEENPVKAEITK